MSASFSEIRAKVRKFLMKRLVTTFLLAIAGVAFMAGGASAVAGLFEL